MCTVLSQTRIADLNPTKYRFGYYCNLLSYNDHVVRLGCSLLKGSACDVWV